MSKAVIADYVTIARKDITVLSAGSNDTLHDYDLIYIYPYSHWPANNIDWSGRIDSFLSEGKTVVVFCNAYINTCLGRIFPYGISFTSGSGKKIKYQKTPEWGKFYDTHIKKYDQYITLQSQPGIQGSFTPLLGPTDTSTIAFKHSEKSIYFLPDITTDELFDPENVSAETDLLDLILSRKRDVDQKLPDWLADDKYKPKKVAKIEEEVQKSLAQIGKINNKISTLEAQKQKLLRWQELTYEGNKALEMVVTDALSLLGANNEEPFDDGTNELEHVFKVGDKLFVGDSKGKSKALGKDDISQLRTNTAAYETTIEKGVDGQVIFLNHYRSQSPDERKEPAEQNLVQLAQKFKIKIILTTDLFNLVKTQIDGDATAKKTYRNALLSEEYGLVRLV